MIIATKLLHHLTDLFEACLPDSGAGEADLHQTIQHLKNAGSPNPVKPFMPPVVEQWLKQCCQQPCDPRHQACIDALLEIGPTLRWFTPPVEYAGKTLAENYAFVRLMGPPLFDGPPNLFDSDEISAGFTIQAPQIFYPSHWHPAAEFYSVLTGTGRWQIDDKPFMEMLPGSFIYHPSDVPHAMETTDEPMLTAYSWIGDINTRPVAIDYEY